ncbi:MAG TPA: SRPBCC domain-containing protein [Candidatus Acidoferrum sp.]|jgi:activator of HSP90 ATPase
MSEVNSGSLTGKVATRRQLIAGMAVAAGGLATSMNLWAAGPQKEQKEIGEPQSTGAEGLLTYLHQEIEFPGAPQRIYDALLDSGQFSSLTGMKAEINREAGGAFTAFGGLVMGRNIELVPGKRIVQAWRPGNWDPGVYSLVKFELKAGKTHTLVVLDHTGFPEGSFRHLNSGWYSHYWEPLAKFLA